MPVQFFGGSDNPWESDESSPKRIGRNILATWKQRQRSAVKSGRGIIVFYEFQHLFELQDTFVIPPGFGDAVQIVMITKNKAKKW